MKTLQNAFLTISLTAVILAILIMGSVPPVSRDALTHHLAVPKRYLQAGEIRELPDIVFSYYPQLLDLIYLVPLVFNNDMAPKYIHFAFGLMTALLVYIYLKKRLGRIYGIIGSLFFLSLPVIVKLSVTVYVDLGLTFFTTAALLGLLEWSGNGFPRKRLIMAAVCCGLAMGTKYNGLLICLILTFFPPLIYLNQYKKENRNDDTKKRHSIRAVSYGAGFFLIAMAVFSPWMVKNFVWKNNPVYPLYDAVFNPPQTVEPAEKPRINHFLARKYVYNETGWETLLIPIRIFFQGRDDDPKRFDGRLNPFLLVLPLVAMLFARSQLSERTRGEINYLFGFAVLVILFVFLLQDMRIRYIAPAIPPLIILSVYGLHGLVAKPGPGPTTLRYTLAVIGFAGMLLLNGTYMVDLFKKTDPISYLSGAITRDQYITRVWPEYEVLKYANTHIQGDVKILAFFLGNRRYYSDHPMGFNRDLFIEIVRDSSGALDIVKGLEMENVSHLVIYHPKFLDWLHRKLSRDELKKVEQFFALYAKPMFVKGEHGLHRINFK